MYLGRFKVVVKVGLVLNLIQSIFLIIVRSGFNNSDSDFFSSLFLIGYVLTFGYLITILLSGVYRKKNRVGYSSTPVWALLISAFSLSAYILNETMSVFSNFVGWTWVYVFLIHCSLIGIVFYGKLNNALKIALSVIISCAILLSIYQAIYLLPILPISVMVCFFFGFSLHAVVPWFVLVFLTVFYIRHLARSKGNNIAFFSAIGLQFAFVFYFLSVWNGVVSSGNEVNKNIIKRPNAELPTWVMLSQQLETGFIQQKALEGGLVYDQVEMTDRWLFGGGGIGGDSMAERKWHDPLVSMGLALIGEIEVSKDDKLKILNAQFDYRHLTERKLWSGTHLTTSNVLTNIEMYPAHRLAYIEKVISIKNNNQNRWKRPEEALYTFYLPPGSVASSLSLWIDGKEEKSRLTTKSKADSAYSSIVGIERRDPALLHWQEGNRLTVTVFPCTVEEARKFRLGVTIPLEEKNDKLSVVNIPFSGPFTRGAKETTRLIIHGNDGRFSSSTMNLHPATEASNIYEYDGGYVPDWEISIPSQNISKEAFVHNGYSYLMKEIIPINQSFNCDRVYLDINESWTKEEVSKVISVIKNKEVLVNYDGIKKLHGVDDPIVERLQRDRFSLFPFSEISADEACLVVTKGSLNSPNLTDLEGSVFASKLRILGADENVPKVYNISTISSPYVNTLSEFGAINQQFGSIEDLGGLLAKNKFPTIIESANSIQVGASILNITKDSTISANSGKNVPDHLMRLFNYNSILNEIGPDYFNTGEYEFSNLIDLANDAHIVSPISSMIVLETVKDYDRFDIEDSKGGLKNASINSSGEVPEPHEWVLIILGLAILSRLYLKR